jgi:hypothetical protein
MENFEDRNAAKSKCFSFPMHKVDHETDLFSRQRQTSITIFLPNFGVLMTVNIIDKSLRKINITKMKHRVLLTSCKSLGHDP